MNELEDFFATIGNESELVENVAADEDVGTIVNRGFHGIEDVVEFDFDEIRWFDSAGLSHAAFAPLDESAC
jgi:hypothetical protein